MYEFIIAFDQEIRTGWQRKFSLTTFLLISTRWSMLLLQVTTCLAEIPRVGSLFKYTLSMVLTIPRVFLSGVSASSRIIFVMFETRSVYFV